MRSLLLAIFCLAAAAAAERETFTLKDGRTLVGVYDESASTITLDGKVRAVMPLRADEIRSRDAAPAQAAKPATARKAASEPTIDEDTATPPVLAALDEATKATEVEERRHKDALEGIWSKRHDTVCKWLATAKLDDIPMPTLSSDPKQSEAIAHQVADNFNAHLAQLRRCRERTQPGQYDPGEDAAQVLDRIVAMKMAPLMRGR